MLRIELRIESRSRAELSVCKHWWKFKNQCSRHSAKKTAIVLECSFCYYQLKNCPRSTEDWQLQFRICRSRPALISIHISCRSWLGRKEAEPWGQSGFCLRNTPLHILNCACREKSFRVLTSNGDFSSFYPHLGYCCGYVFERLKAVDCHCVILLSKWHVMLYVQQLYIVQLAVNVQRTVGFLEISIFSRCLWLGTIEFLR